MRRAFCSLILLLAALQPAFADTGGNIVPGDRVQLKVQNEPDLSKEFVVDQSGSITLELVGPVKIGGLSPAQAEPLLVQKIARYVRKPVVTVQVLQRVAVAGGVHTPGAYDFPKDQPIRVMDAVMKAGGFAEKACKNRVLVVRRTAAGVPPKTELVDIEAYFKKGKVENNPTLGFFDLD